MTDSLPGMADPGQTRTLTPRQRLDLLALLLVLAGLALLVVVGFMVDHRAGLAAVGGAAVVVGVLLGLQG